MISKRDDRRDSMLNLSINVANVDMFSSNSSLVSFNALIL